MAASASAQQGLLSANDNPFATSPPVGGVATGRIDANGGSTVYQGATQETILQQSSHPVALIFHVAFRLTALFLYILSGWFTEGFVLVFVLCVLLLAFDFWTVKNVSGRLLVGLRWWNDVHEDGSSTWVFESREPTRGINPVDAKVFWYTLYGTPAIWGLLTLVAVIRVHWVWILVPVIALMLSIANLIGYQRCERDARQRWSNWSGTLSNSNGLLGSLVQRGMMSWLTRNN